MLQSGTLLHTSDDSSDESESRRTENSKLYWSRDNWAVRSLKQAQGVLEVNDKVLWCKCDGLC